MFTTEIHPRFCETDALGHINNTVFAVWCEAARAPIFQVFNPELQLSSWNLIVANLNIKMVAPCYFPDQVLIHTKVNHIGHSSFEVQHEIYQHSLVAEVTAVLVHYNYQRKEPTAIGASFEHSCCRCSM